MKVACLAALLIGSAGLAWADDADDVERYLERRRMFEIAKRARKIEESEAAFKKAPKEKDLNAARKRAADHQREIATVKAQIAVLNKWKGKPAPPLNYREVGAVGRLVLPLRHVQMAGKTDFVGAFLPSDKFDDPLLMVRGLDISKTIEVTPKPGPGAAAAEEKAVLIPGIVTVTGTTTFQLKPGLPARITFIVQPLDVAKATKELEIEEKNLKASGP